MESKVHGVIHTQVMKDERKMNSNLTKCFCESLNGKNQQQFCSAKLEIQLFDEKKAMFRKNEATEGETRQSMITCLYRKMIIIISCIISRVFYPFIMRV